VSTELMSKLNQLLQKLPKGAIATDVWLKRNGISNDLKRRYIDGHWLDVVGHGACKRYGDRIEWPGAVWGAIQQGIELHVGGKTALGLHGLGHYVRVNEVIILFKESRVPLPNWFAKAVSDKFRLIKTKFLPTQLGISELAVEGLKIPVSQPERAILEHIYCIGKTESFEEASLLMESLTGLRPSLMQQLLESCSSIKTKRVLLFLGEYHDHKWFKKLNVNRIDLGSGKRQIVTPGELNKQYQITIPKGFIKNAKNVH